MKKTLVLLLIMTLLFSLAACSSGSGSENGEQASKEAVSSGQSKEDDTTEAVEKSTSEESTTNAEETAKFLDFIKDFVDINHYDTVDSVGANGSIGLKDDFRPDYSKYKDASLVNDISVVYEDDMEIKKGTKYQEILDKGWEPKDDLDYASVESNYIYSGITLYKNDKCIQISLMTEKKETTPIKDCVVASVVEYSYKMQDSIIKDSFDLSKEDPSSPDYTINGKVSKESDLKDIISAFGEPDQITNGENALDIQYRDTGNGELQFLLSPDGDVIAYFYLSWHE